MTRSNRLRNSALTKLFNETFNTLDMAIGVRLEPELELQLDQLARSKGKSRSACVREAIALYVEHFGGPAEAKRQSQLIAAHSASAHWSEQVPDWGDWTA